MSSAVEPDETQLVVGAAILRDGRILAARRAAGDGAGNGAGGWEFPGGKVEPGEDPAAAVVREVREELGCAVEVVGWLDAEVEIRADLTLRVALTDLSAGEPVPSPGDHDAVRWLAPADLGSLDWLEADRPFVAEIMERLVVDDD
ncbi:8-oxo-dGTP diphosphatase [Marmoricola sp. OAE513]|uniref:NUDIX domain-containing protein n=1 Tax=Marmoricola sp. OAE513 TaxID=2817894 RepID=UPI001AE51820